MAVLVPWRAVAYTVSIVMVTIVEVVGVVMPTLLMATLVTVNDT